jgi:hypothetical protein
MDFTLDQLLTIVGRLDDSPGFDTPRERYRRFLQDRVTVLESARLLIQHCREQSGEQSHRALQDVMTVFGRFLGFETTFRRYQHDPGDPPIHGTWQARHRLHIALTLCSDQMFDIDLETIAGSVSADAAGTGTRIGLLVATPLFAARDRVERALAAGKYPNLRLASLRGLLRLAALVDGRHLSSDDVLQVFNPAVSLDARVDLLERVAAAARPTASNDAALSLSQDESRGRRYWVNAMRIEAFTPTERIVRSLLGTRQILGINPAPGIEDRVRIGDAICVFIAGRGIVAHATIAGILTDGSRIIRNARRFTHVLRLTDVTLYDTPVVPNQDLARKLDLALAEDPEAVTVSISPREFDSITTHALSEAG